MKRTIKARKFSVDRSEVRVISTYDLRAIVGGTSGGGGQSEDKPPRYELTAGESS